MGGNEFCCMSLFFISSEALDKAAYGKEALDLCGWFSVCCLCGGFYALFYML
jgi:hypothetical protein